MTAPELSNAPDATAVGAPVEQPVRPDPFRDWFASLSQEERYNFDSDGRAYKKDAGQMMRMAWNASAAAERERWEAKALNMAANYRRNGLAAEADGLEGLVAALRGTWA